MEDEKDSQGKDQYLESILDEYYNLDFEDLIGGGQVKTRFKYRKVAQEDFGLTEDEILLLDDNQLNKLVSLKKYRPYVDMIGEDEDKYESLTVKRKHHEITDKVNIHRVKHLKKQLEGELREKKKMLKQSLQQSLEQDKEKYFKDLSGGKSHSKQDDQSKNKKRKEKYREKQGGEEEPAEEEDQKEEDEEAKKKRKRLALYGVKQ